MGMNVAVRGGELTSKQRKQIAVINKCLRTIQNNCESLLDDDSIVGIEDLVELREEVDDWKITIVEDN